MPNMYERYSGVAEVLVMIVIAFGGTGAAGLRTYRIRRKNRIDTYYERAIAVWDSIGDDSTPADRNAAADKLEALQKSACEALINENLAADDSFRISITWSIDIISGPRG